MPKRERSIFSPTVRQVSSRNKNLRMGLVSLSLVIGVDAAHLQFCSAPQLIVKFKMVEFINERLNDFNYVRFLFLQRIHLICEK